MPDLPGRKYPDNIFLHLRPMHRLAIGLLCALVTWLFIRTTGISVLVQLVLLWDVFCTAILICAWIVFFTCSPAQIRHIAGQEDGSRFFVFVIVLLSSMASMVTVLLLILSKESFTKAGLYLPVAIAGMLLCWIMVHTTFCFHYANMYYRNDRDKPETHAEGLEFPEEDAPDYLDFAYFSFVIGMTFQVSDVEISSRAIRRQALVHGLLSFGLNTFVVALTVNLIAGLKG
jgi:uncharacterized membrane protein